LSHTTAGEHGKKVERLTRDALTSVKISSTAGSSFVFNDLMALAKECGADPHSSPVFRLAQRFLLALPISMLISGSAPELSRDDDGDIIFDWAGVGGRMFTIALNETGMVFYAARLSALDKEHGTKQFVDTIPKPILELIQRVSTS
jgi:hypothetical protein